jgi:hypothetical protein
MKVVGVFCCYKESLNTLDNEALRVLKRISLLQVSLYLCSDMGQKKLLRFAQIKEFSNVLEYPKDVAGTWNNIFNNNHPIVLELACGRGEYAVGLADMFPENNFIADCQFRDFRGGDYLFYFPLSRSRPR